MVLTCCSMTAASADDLSCFLKKMKLTINSSQSVICQSRFSVENLVQSELAHKITFMVYPALWVYFLMSKEWGGEKAHLMHRWRVLWSLSWARSPLKTKHKSFDEIFDVKQGWQSSSSSYSVNSELWPVCKQHLKMLFHQVASLTACCWCCPVFVKSLKKNEGFFGFFGNKLILSQAVSTESFRQSKVCFAGERSGNGYRIS